MKKNEENTSEFPKDLAIPNSVSKRITSLRWLLIVFVVFIHNNFSKENADYYNIAFSQPARVFWLKSFISNSISCSAVPLFFMFSAYLQFSKQDKYPMLLKKKIQSLLIPYIIWTLLYICAFFTAQSLPWTKEFFINPQNYIRNWTLINWIGAFVGKTFREDGFPLVYQFWFIRDLMILCIISPFLHFLSKHFPIGTFLLIASMTICEIKIFLAETSALFFFICGMYWALYKIPLFETIDKIKWTEILPLWIFATILDISFSEKFVATSFLKTIFACIIIIKLSERLISSEKLYKKLEYLSGISFFLYAFHEPFFLTSLKKISYKIIPMHGIWTLFQYLIPTLLCIFIGTLTGVLLRRFIPKLFSILTGNRNKANLK